MRRTILAVIPLVALGFDGFADEAVSNEIATLAPQDVHPRTARIIVEQVRLNHFSQNTRLDDSVSSEVFDQYLDSLDPRRIFLLSDDIEEFEQYRFRFDDALRVGKLEAGFEMFNRVQKRQVSRFGWALERIEQGLDSFELDGDGSMKDRRKDVAWPVDEADADRIWEQILVDNIIGLRLNDKTDEEIVEELTKRYTQAKRREVQTNEDDAFATYINAFTTWFDPHTEYLPPRLEDQFNIQMSLSLQGIGAVLTTEEEYVQIQSLVAGGPAELHGGVEESDLIVAVGQQPNAPLTSVVGWRLDDVVEMIRGPKGTTVLLELKKPEEQGETRVVSIVRDEVKLEMSAASKRMIEIDEAGQERRIGVIDLPSMYIDFDAKREGKPDFRSATKDVRKLVNELRAEGMDGLIIDLRGNGGGSLEEAHTLTGLFIPTGPTVLVKPSRSKATVYRDLNPEVVWSGPLAVIVNHRSASASEIFAGAIQDYGRGLVVGTQTFGKGTVQQLVPVRHGQLKITQAKYYRITGESTQHDGVFPDIEFPSPVDRDTFGESEYDYTLSSDVIEGPVYKPIGDLSPHFNELIALHEERTEENPDFVYLRALEQRMLEDKEKAETSLNQTVRTKEKNEYDEWRLAVENDRLEGKGYEPSDSLDALDDVLEKVRDREEEEEIPDGVLMEASYILNDLIDLDMSLAVTE